MTSKEIEKNNFSRFNAIWASFRHVVKSAGSIALGDAVLVPIKRVTYELRVARIHAFEPTIGETTIVDQALRKALLSPEDGPSFEEFYGIPKNTLWDRGGNNRDWDALIDNTGQSGFG